MDSKTMDCPSCGQLTAQMKEDSSISHRQYDQLLQKLMELERQGDMELYAGDCPLEDAARCWTLSSTILSATICNAAAAEPSTLWEPASGVRRSFGRWQTSEKRTWTPGCGAGVEPITYRKKTEGGVNMDVVKLPKKVRMVCYEIMDGKEGALDTLESFADKYPHQVAAVKAEVAYFNLDYEKALALDLTILPWLEEWYYSNVSDEHMIAMTVAAIQLHREQELIEALTKEQTRIRAENGLPQRDRFCDILMDYLKRGLMPFADNDKNYPYHEPEEPQTKEQLWAKLVEQNKKLSPDDPDARRKLYNHCCMFGTARDAVDLFEEIQGVPMADSSYRDAIARYLYLGEREKALQTAEQLATSRLWAVAGPTQVRPMSFFEDPNLRELLLEPESLRRIREAAFIDDGSLIRK